MTLGAGTVSSEQEYWERKKIETLKRAKDRIEGLTRDFHRVQEKLAIHEHYARQIELLTRNNNMACEGKDSLLWDLESMANNLSGIKSPPTIMEQLCKSQQSGESSTIKPTARRTASSSLSRARQSSRKSTRKKK